MSTSTPQPCPVDVAVRIAARIADAVVEADGELDALDVAALEATFPRHAAEVRAQIAALRASSEREDPRGHRGAGDVPSALGPYQLRRRLGDGGAGVVYEAFDEDLQRIVALKILKTPWLMRREGRPLAALSGHPNITQVYAIEEHDGFAMLVMERVSGASLDRIVEEHRRSFAARPATLRELLDSTVARQDGGTTAPRAQAPPTATPRTPRTPIAPLGVEYQRDVARALAGAARALHHAHGAGIIHRDVKPANLILTPEGLVKVTDFSHAKGEGLDRISRTGQFVGTLPYASPEQVRARGIGRHSDVWSLGVTLHELVTLALPFEGRDEDELCRRILAARLEPPRRRNPGLHPDLERIILRCLDPVPTHRYVDAAALAIDLERFAADDPILARPTNVLRRLWYRRRKTMVALAFTFLATAAVGLGWLLGQYPELQRIAHLERVLDAAIARARHGVAVRDEGEMRRGLDAATGLLEERNVPLTWRGRLDRLRGWIAFEQGDVRAARAWLVAAETVEPLDAEHEITLARAEFACGGEGLRSAGSRYDRSLADADLAEDRRAALRDERALLARYAERVRLTVHGMTDAIAVPGLVAGERGASGVLLVESVLPRDGCFGLRYYPQGLIAPDGVGEGVFHRWTSTPPRPLRADPAERTEEELAILRREDPGGRSGATRWIASLGTDGGAIVFAGVDGLWLGRGPYDAERGPATWQRVDDPVLTAFDGARPPPNLDGYGRAPLEQLRQVLAVPWGDGATTTLVSGRYRTLGAVTLRTTATAWEERLERVHRPNAEFSHADVLRLLPVPGLETPAFLVGWGPWTGWGFELFARSSLGRFVSMARIVLGSASDALVLPPADGTGDPCFLFATGGPALYLSDLTFGRSRTYGWDYGVHAFRLDRPTGSFRAVGSLTFPRREGASVRLFRVDLLDGDEAEILFSESTSSGFHGDRHQAFRTTVLSLVERGDGVHLERRLQLPGAVLATIARGPRRHDLVVQFDDRTFAVVRCER